MPNAWSLSIAGWVRVSLADPFKIRIELGRPNATRQRTGDGFVGQDRVIDACRCRVVVLKECIKPCADLWLFDGSGVCRGWLHNDEA